MRSLSIALDNINNNNLFTLQFDNYETLHVERVTHHR